MNQDWRSRTEADSKLPSGAEQHQKVQAELDAIIGPALAKDPSQETPSEPTGQPAGALPSKAEKTGMSWFLVALALGAVAIAILSLGQSQSLRQKTDNLEQAASTLSNNLVNVTGDLTNLKDRVVYLETDKIPAMEIQMKELKKRQPDSSTSKAGKKQPPTSREASQE